jgi:hypothetical protein
MPMQQSTRQADINITAIGDNIVIPLMAGRKIRVWKIWLKADGAANLIFKSGVGGTAFNAGAVNLAVGEQWEKPQDEVPLWQTAKGVDFVINSSSIGPVVGRVDFTYHG